MAKVRGIVSTYRKSGKSRDVLKKMQKKLRKKELAPIADVQHRSHLLVCAIETIVAIFRWNHSLLMLRRFLELWDSIQRAATDANVADGAKYHHLPSPAVGTAQSFFFPNDIVHCLIYCRRLTQSESWLRY